MAEKKAKKTETAQQPVDLLDVLLDKDNKEPIVLQDEKGRQISFEQVAIIPFDLNGSRVLYVVLKPIDKVEGIADDEAVVFIVDQDKNGNTILRVEEDEEVAIAVFDKYYDLLEEARGTKKSKAETAKKASTSTKAPAKTATKAAPKTTAKAEPRKTTTRTAGRKTK